MLVCLDLLDRGLVALQRILTLVWVAIVDALGIHLTRRDILWLDHARLLAGLGILWLGLGVTELLVRCHLLIGLELLLLELLWLCLGKGVGGRLDEPWLLVHSAKATLLRLHVWILGDICKLPRLLLVLALHGRWRLGLVSLWRKAISNFLN